ncbi:hypothetical protein LOAG_04704 [Loa loa]|uniref:G-protein coupled receptors family 2 profile 2 domain-containing protein n=1 Tax=Loa loa TaxID=7209 RepID=A0A1S0U1G7_LOALO|nr:hypothetical protein LOAG_04704 [Loa loa]EFO23783.1 hypothetical protein LOAG_04704 [Loa loa]
MCACIFVLCAFYSFAHNGIFDPEACRAVTVAQHFFFLAIYFWIMQAFRLLQGEFSKIVRDYSQGKDGEKVHAEVEEVPLYGTIMEMYFIAYGIPLIATSTVLATDTLSHESSLKFCFPSSMMHIKIFAYAVYAPLLTCTVLTLGMIVIILRLLITIRHLSVKPISQQYVDNKSPEENTTQARDEITSAEFSKRANAAKTQFLWLLLIAVLYSLDCYVAATHINQLNDSGLSVTSNSYFNALFNILLALAIFYPFMLESICMIVLKSRDSSCSACVTKPFVSAPYNNEERIVPLVQRGSIAGCFVEGGEWV